MKHRPVRKTITFRGITVTPENGWIHCPCGTDFTGADHYATVATWMEHTTSSPSHQPEDAA